jgi:hypothetical protein
MVELNRDEMGAVVNRLCRAQGQIGGILRMIEEGRGTSSPSSPRSTTPWTGRVSPSSRPASSSVWLSPTVPTPWTSRLWRSYSCPWPDLWHRPLKPLHCGVASALATNPAPCPREDTSHV